MDGWWYHAVTLDVLQMTRLVMTLAQQQQQFAVQYLATPQRVLIQGVPRDQPGEIPQYMLAATLRVDTLPEGVLVVAGVLPWVSTTPCAGKDLPWPQPTQDQSQTCWLHPLCYQLFAAQGIQQPGQPLVPEQLQQAIAYVQEHEPETDQEQEQTAHTVAIPALPSRKRPEPGEDERVWGMLRFADGWELPLRKTHLIIGRTRHPEAPNKPHVNLGGVAYAETVSRQHACLEHWMGTAFLTPLAHTNTTARNGVCLPQGQAVALQDGDSLLFGAVSCTVHLSNPKEEGISIRQAEQRTKERAEALLLALAGTPTPLPQHAEIAPTPSSA